MSPMEYILLIAVVAGGAFVQRVTGFGMGIFAMLFLPYFLPSSGMCAAIMGLMSLISSTVNAVKKRSHIQWKAMLPMAASSFLVIPGAVALSAYLPQAMLKRLLGVVLVLLSVYFLFFSKRIHLKPTVGSGVAAGVVGGALSGLFSTGGPPAVLYLIHATRSNLAYFATIQAYFAITSVFTSVSRVVTGIITLQVLLLSAVALVGNLAGNLLGGVVFDKLNADRLRKIVYISMLLSGLLMIVQL